MLKTVGTMHVCKQKDGGAFAWSESGKVLFLNLAHSRYDKNAEQNRTLDFFKAKAFDSHLIDRMQKMNIKAGSNVSVVATLELSYWTDKESGKKRSEPVLILQDIEYTPTNSKPKEGGNGNSQSQAPSSQPNPQQGAGQTQQQANTPPASASQTGGEYEFYDGSEYSFTEDDVPTGPLAGADEDPYNV